MKKLKGKPDNCLKIILRKKEFNNFVTFTQELKIFSLKKLDKSQELGYYNNKK
jgi:hypothetical protein